MMKTKAYFLRQLPNVGRVSRECEGIPHLTGSGCFIGIVLSNRIESNQIKSNQIESVRSPGARHSVWMLLCSL